MIQGLIGPENVANPTLSSIATNFGLAPLIGKTAAIISDARLSGRIDIAAVVERLLSISGEDAQTIDRKHLPAWTGRLTARFMVVSNELPKLSDSSGALTGRMIVVPLSHSFYGNEDIRLSDRLMGELPGILLWAIAGWDRVRERGHFVQPEAAREMVDEMDDLSSPAGAFVKERCKIGPEFEVAVKELFSAWGQWCEEKGKDHKGDQPTFGRNLRAAVPHLATTQRRRNGHVIRVFSGIAIA